MRLVNFYLGVQYVKYVHLNCELIRFKMYFRSKHPLFSVKTLRIFDSVCPECPVEFL